MDSQTRNLFREIGSLLIAHTRTGGIRFLSMPQPETRLSIARSFMLVDGSGGAPEEIEIGSTVEELAENVATAINAHQATTHCEAMHDGQGFVELFALDDSQIVLSTSPVNEGAIEFTQLS